jgi:uncharacterized protein involved in type VI secretion and phage assembly
MSRRYGIYPARVERVDDPQGEGRVRVSFPWMGGNNQGYWAPIANAMSGPGRGFWIMPEVGDEAVVMFEQGDPNHPWIVGFSHNGDHRPPETDNHTRMWRSVNGHEIAINDPDVVAGDQGGIRISDSHGNLIELSNARIVIRSVGQIEISGLSVVIQGRSVGPAPSLI